MVVICWSTLSARLNRLKLVMKEASAIVDPPQWQTVHRGRTGSVPPIFASDPLIYMHGAGRIDSNPGFFFLF